MHVMNQMTPYLDSTHLFIQVNPLNLSETDILADLWFSPLSLHWFVYVFNSPHQMALILVNDLHQTAGL